MPAALTFSVDEATLARLDEAAAARETTREALAEAALYVFLDEAACADEDALLQDWQTSRIRRGIAEADRGAFVSEAEIGRITSKYDDR